MDGIEITTEQLEKSLESGADLTEEQVAAMLDGTVDVPEVAVDGETKAEESPTSEGESADDADETAGGEETQGQGEADSAGNTSGEEDGGSQTGDDNDGDESESVILAKDGKHTIPYEKLVEAREAAKAAKEMAKEWQEISSEKDKLIEELKEEAGIVGDDTEGQASDMLSEVEGMSEEEYAEFKEDYPAAAAKFEALMKKIESIEQISADVARDKHIATITAAHPDATQVVASEAFSEWIKAQPDFIKEAYLQVYKSGTAGQVIEMLDAFKNATGGDKPGEGAAADKPKESAEKIVEKKMQEAKGKAKAPSSLSDIPGGAAHHDEGEAMREMSPMSLMDKFEGKTQEQIEDLLARAL